jgi:hypothetical protein
MPALDHDHYIVHYIVKNALIKEGWTITHDPLTLSYERRDLHVGLGAEQKVIGAERNSVKIAVEIKPFSGPSDVANLHNATGQYIVYKSVLELVEPERSLYLAIPDDVVQTFFRDDLGGLLVSKGTLMVIGYDPNTEVIKTWIPPQTS